MSDLLERARAWAADDPDPATRAELLALFKHLAPGLWPYAWFDNSPSNFYSWVAEGRRERGSFAEPSILGMFLAMSLAYLVSAIVRATLRQHARV